MNTDGANMEQITSESYEENIISDLLYTRDIQTYLECIDKIKTDYFVILSVKDTTVNNMPKTVFEKLKQIGFSQLTLEHWRTYIGVIDRGNVVFDKCGEKDDLPVEFSFKKDNVDIFVQSQAHGSGQSIIKIDGEDYSMNGRGLNLVIYDFVNRKIVDSVTYDPFLPKQTFYHKKLNIDEKTFNSHFYIKPQFYDDWKRVYTRSYFSDRQLHTAEVENGYIIPAKRIGNHFQCGVLDQNLKYIAGHQFYSHQANTCNRCVTEGYDFDTDKADFINETVVFGGIIFDHIGHQIVESFAERLWFFVKNPDVNFRIAFINIWGNGEAKFFKEFSSLLGIKEEQLLQVTRPMKFSKIIVPDQADIPYIWNDNYEYTQEFVSVFDKIRSNLTPSERKKIYLTKRKTRRNNIVGESFFIDFYKSRGFEIIDPEDYSLIEKANIMYNAEEVVSQAGTNLLFLVFCQKDVKVTMLTRTSREPLGFHAMINDVANIDINNIYYVDTSMEFFYIHGSFGVCWMGVTQQFIEYAKNKYNINFDFTEEDYMREHLYEYLCKCVEFYQNPEFFNYLKNQKMLTLLQNMSYVLKKQKFDTSLLDLTTYDADYQTKIKQLNAELSLKDKEIDIIHDIVTNKKLPIFLKMRKVSNASLLCNDERISSIIQEILSSYGVQVISTAYYANCNNIPEDVWRQFKRSDIVLWYNYNNSDPGVRDNISVFNIRDILNNPLENTVGKSAKIDMSVIDELLKLKEETSKKFEEILKNISDMQNAE